MSERDAAQFEAPFEYVKAHVKPLRDANRRAKRKEQWWLHGETVPAIRAGQRLLSRYLCTSQTAKHRFFVWVTPQTLPNSTVILHLRDDYYFFGVVHSSIHLLWARRLGTQLESRPRYTATRSFETFPLRWPPGKEPAEDPRYVAIAEAARELDRLRSHRLADDPVMTLTGLYNLNPQWLQDAHGTLDKAVFAAYGWDPDMPDEEVLGNLLALNLERAAD
jgi:hypothetical protein